MGWRRGRGLICIGGLFLDSIAECPRSGGGWCSWQGLSHRSLSGTFRSGFFSLESSEGSLIMRLGPFCLNRSRLFNHFTSEDLGKPVDRSNHAGWNGLRKRMVDNPAERFLAKLGSFVQIISFGLRRVESINQYTRSSKIVVSHAIQEVRCTRNKQAHERHTQDSFSRPRYQ